MVSDEQLASAIRSIGRSGEPFSSATLRAHLGMTTDDRRTFASFNDALRNYSKVNDHLLERVGKNRYRLLDPDPAPEPEIDERPLRQIVIRISYAAAEEEPEPQVFWLWAWLAKLLPFRRTLRLGDGS